MRGGAQVGDCRSRFVFILSLWFSVFPLVSAPCGADIDVSPSPASVLEGRDFIDPAQQLQMFRCPVQIYRGPVYNGGHRGILEWDYE